MGKREELVYAVELIKAELRYKTAYGLLEELSRRLEELEEELEGLDEDEDTYTGFNRIKHCCLLCFQKARKAGKSPTD